MGIDYDADLGYGIKLTEELETDDPNFKTIASGNCYTGDIISFLCIKESVHSASSYDDEPFINPNELIVQPDWDNKIYSWCKENGIIDPKIGWWLCAIVA